MPRDIRTKIGSVPSASQLTIFNASPETTVAVLTDTTPPPGIQPDAAITNGDPSTATAEESAASADTDVLLDLSVQQRNLLLMRPLFDLEQGKRNVLGSNGESGMMADIDSHYLSLSLLDFLMEGVAIGSGRYPAEVMSHLATICGAMDPRLDAPDRRKVAEHVLGHLSNARENYREFSFDYFDAKTRRAQECRFKLLTFEPDIEENYLFKPTEEGYLVYLGMLDLSPEDAAELMEKMLQLLIKRNKFAQAIDIAKRARALSIEFRQIIRDTITRARRTPRAVDWHNDIQCRLDKARIHVSERRKEDGTMMLSVRGSLSATDEFDVRQNIIKLIEILQSSSNLRAKLHTEIMQAPDQYLHAHSLVFRVRGPSNLPSLEEVLFPRVMALPVDRLAADSDTAIAAGYPPKFPHLFEFNSVFALLLDKRAKPELVEDEDEGSIVQHEALREMFTPEEIAAAEDWIAARFQSLTETTVEELLTAAGHENLDRSIILCIALFLYIAINESTQFKHVDISISNKTFRTQHVRGTSLSFKRRGQQ